MQRSPRRRSESDTPSTAPLTESIASVEASLNGVMEARMSSLNDFRRKIDELAELQRREALRFGATIRDALDTSAHARREQQHREEDWNALLRQGAEERDRALALAATLRREGTAAMNELKARVRALQARCDDEAEARRRVAAQLAEAQERAAQASQVGPLLRLLEDNDAIIVELETRNKTLEARLADALLGGGRGPTPRSGRPGDAANTGGAGSDVLPRAHESAALVREALAADTTGNPLADKCRRALAAVAAQLAAEKGQRLRIEEQAARMASAQDDLLRRMERRVKELERERQAAHRRPEPASLLSSNGHPQAAAAASVSGGAAKGVAPLPLPSLPPAASHAPSGVRAHAHAEYAAALFAAPSVAMKAPAAASLGVDAAEIGFSPAPLPAEHAGHHLPSSHDAVPYDDDANGGGGTDSLEEQLAAVSADFHRSLREWSDALATTTPSSPELHGAGAGGVDFAEFLPVSPPPTVSA